LVLVEDHVEQELPAQQLTAAASPGCAPGGAARLLPGPASPVRHAGWRREPRPDEPGESLDRLDGASLGGIAAGEHRDDVVPAGAPDAADAVHVPGTVDRKPPVLQRHRGPP